MPAAVGRGRLAAPPGAKDAPRAHCGDVRNRLEFPEPAG